MLKQTFRACMALIPLLLRAQFGAAVQGTVSDPSGAVIPNANVTLTNNETQRKLTGTTNGEGFYRFSGLAPGSYSLTAAAPNFTSAQIQTIPIRAEQTQGVNVVLTPGPVTENVVVTGEAPNLLQTES